MSTGRLTFADAAKISPNLIDAISALSGAGLGWATLAEMDGVNEKVLRAAGMATSLRRASSWAKKRHLAQVWRMPSGQLTLTQLMSMYQIFREPLESYGRDFTVAPIPLARVWRMYRELDTRHALAIQHVLQAAELYERGHLGLRVCPTCAMPQLVMAPDLATHDEHDQFQDGCQVCSLYESLKEQLKAAKLKVPQPGRTVISEPVKALIQSAASATHDHPKDIPTDNAEGLKPPS
ncbi:MAG: hypothetical protein ACREPQ_14120 [Rhodanobacter sp.]